MNIFYIGSSASLSLVPFGKLQSSTHRVVAVGVDNPLILRHKIIALENESLALAANQQGIPVIDLSRSTAAVIAQCADYAIDVILMSCYARRLPMEVVAVAGHGGFNMHPSLLPRYRGAEPIFWQMKHASDVGVSWHRISHEIDAGNIVSQRMIKPADGASYTDISGLLAQNGAELMLQLLSDLGAGCLAEEKQNDEVASSFHYPQPGDFVIDNRWTVRHAWNFMRATQIFGHSYRYRHAGNQYRLERAVGIDENRHLDTVMSRDGLLYIPLKEGVLISNGVAKMQS